MNANANNVKWISKQRLSGYFSILFILFLFIAVFIGASISVFFAEEIENISIPLIILSVLSLFPIFGIIYVLLCVKTTIYTVTNDRVIKRYGIITKNEESIKIADIRKISCSQSVVQAIFKIGNVEFDSAGGVVIFADVKPHKELADYVDDVRHRI